MSTIPLRDAIRALRTELTESVREAETETVRFELGSVELEFQVVATREATGSAKVGFHIFAAEAELGAGGKGVDERTQRVKLVLNPMLAGSGGQKAKLEIARGDK
jgi:Trypsin-co-occurring domain 2